MKQLEEFMVQRSRQRKLLVAYVTAGFPDEQRFLELLPLLEASGADAIELGLPFSDPLADGPVIQRASAAAIDSGMTSARALELASRLQGKLAIPLIAMGYVNPLLSYGVQRFLADAAAAGISGLILPDLPLDGDRVTELAIARSPLARIQLVAPSSSAARISRLARTSEGFIYLVSRLGVTGGQITANGSLPGIIEDIRANSTLPLLTGFGISDARSASAAAAHCDGVIIGSALIERLESDNPLQAAAEFIAGIRRALDHSAQDSGVALEESRT
ncbi:tryptophan synthase subunit alpha [bacterium]|nr:tryptophan synthase subunit alpha [bacterium]